MAGIFLLLLPLAGIVAVWFGPRQTMRWIPALVSGFNLLGGILLFFFPPQFGTFNAGRISLVWPEDRLSLVVTCITLVVGFTGALYSAHYLQHSPQRKDNDTRAQRLYFTMFLLFYTTLLAVSVVQNLFIMWAAIELTALSSVLLVDWDHTKQTHEASWKYLVIMVVCGLFALFGLVLLAGFQRIPVLGSDWTAISAGMVTVPPVVQRAAFALILAGFGAKAGLVPFNFWLPDAHSRAPSPVSAMLSGIKLNSALYGIIRVQQLLHAGGQGAFADTALATIGVITVVISTAMIVTQTDYKRLFAYSSSENLGLIAVAFAFGPLGALAGFLQMANHSLIKSTLFYHSGELLHGWGTTDMRGLHGVASAMPRTGYSLMLGMLAISGAPPFGLFISEFLTLFAIVNRGYLWLAVILLVCLLILFASFLRYAVRIGFGTPSVRLRQHGAPPPAAGIAIPTILHLGSSLALGMLLPWIWHGLTAVGAA